MVSQWRVGPRPNEGEGWYLMSILTVAGNGGWFDGWLEGRRRDEILGFEI